MDPKSGQLISAATGRRLRLVVDARKYGHGGIGTYVENLVDGLLRFHDLELTLLVAPPSVAASPIPESWVTRARIVEEPAPLYSVGEMTRFGAALDWNEVDLVHIPHYTLPFGIPVPTIVTIHDVLHLTHPSRRFLPLVAWPLLAAAVARATRVICPSESTRRELVRRIPLRAARDAAVIPNAVDPFYTPSEAVPRGGYFLSVHSNPKPHKGLADLLCAFDTVYERTGGATRLVLVGGGLTTVLRGPPPRGVTVEEGISKERLRELYRGADAVVVSSKGEGFCLPVVEAHGCGTPIISRPVAAVEELLTPGDVVTEDGSVGALAEALERWYRHCRESTFSEALAEETQRRFSQERVAALTWSVYTAALRSAPRGACTRSDGPPPDAVGNYR